MWLPTPKEKKINHRSKRQKEKFVEQQGQKRRQKSVFFIEGLETLGYDPQDLCSLVLSWCAIGPESRQKESEVQDGVSEKK